MTGRVLVIDADRFLDADFSKLEARVADALHVGLRCEVSVSGNGRHFWVVGTPTGRPSVYEDARRDALRRIETGPALWQLKTADEVYEDVRRFLDSGTAGQDPPHLDFFRSRPFDHIPADAALAPVRKVPPVVAHAPPARRGRWSRG